MQDMMNSGGLGSGAASDPTYAGPHVHTPEAPEVQLPTCVRPCSVPQDGRAAAFGEFDESEECPSPAPVGFTQYTGGSTADQCARTIGRNAG
jgi:hypothetical protein